MPRTFILSDTQASTVILALNRLRSDVVRAETLRSSTPGGLSSGQLRELSAEFAMAEPTAATLQDLEKIYGLLKKGEVVEAQIFLNKLIRGGD